MIVGRPKLPSKHVVVATSERAIQFDTPEDFARFVRSNTATEDLRWINRAVWYDGEVEGGS
jgi:hypothetical protein